MQSVGRIAELIARGLEEDQVAQDAVMKIMKRAENDPELEHSVRDAASRVREGRVQRDKAMPTEKLQQEVDGEVNGQATPREVKLLRLLVEARRKLKEMGGAQESVRAGAESSQDAGVPQGERGAKARPVQGREGGSGQEGRR